MSQRFDGIYRGARTKVIEEVIRRPYRIALLILVGLVTFSVSSSFLFRPNSASALVQPNGRLLYGDATNLGVVKLRNNTYDYTFAAEVNTSPTSSSSHIAYIVAKAAPTRDEAIIGHLKVDGRLDVIRGTNGYDVAGDFAAAWNVISNNAATCTGTTPVDCTRTFDIAYEQLSGRAMVVYAGDTSDAGTVPDSGKLYYCYWNGTSWGPVSNCAPTNGSNDITLSTTGGRPLFVELKSLGGSDKILLGTSLDASGTHEAEALIWNGTSWGNSVLLTDTTNLSTTTLEKGNGMTVAWEESGANAVAIYGTANTNFEVKYKKFDGANWSSETNGWNTNTNGASILGINAERDPTSNRIAAVTNSSASDVAVGIWKDDNSTEGFTATLIDSTIENQTTGPPYSDVMWQASGSQAIVFTQNAGNTADPEYSLVTCTTTCSVGSVDSSIATSGATDDGTFVRLVGSKNSNDIMALYADIDRNLVAQHWNGSAWEGTNAGALEADVSGATADTTIFHNMSATFLYVPYNTWSRNWRFFDDETANDPSTGLNGAAENAAPTGVDLSEYIRLRMNVIDSQAQGQTDARKKLQYASGCTPNSAGGEAACTWTDVGDASDAAAVWRYASRTVDGSAVCADASHCDDNQTFATARLTGTTQNGWYTTDKDAAAGSNMDHNASAVVELDYPLLAQNVTGSTTYYFRLYDVDQGSAIYREQDNDGSNDCASSTCTYPSLTTSVVPDTIKGTVYMADGTTPATTANGGPCDGSTAVISVRAGGGTADTATCSSSNGTFTASLSNVVLSSGAEIAVYLTSTMKANTVYLSDGTSDVGINLYQSRVAVRHENAGPMTIVGMDSYDNDQNATDMLFDAEDSATDTLDVESGNVLRVESGKTFTPGGTVTTPKLHIKGTYTGGSETLTLSGTGTGTSRPLYVDGGTYTPSSNTTVFTGDGDVDITSTDATNFNALTLAPTLTADRAYNFGNQSLTVSSTLTVNPTAASVKTLTVKLGASSTFSGSSSIIEGSGAGPATGKLDTNSAGNYTASFAALTIGANGYLAANASTVNLTNCGATTCLTLNAAGRLDAGTSTVHVTTDSSSTLTSGTFTSTNSFYALTIDPTITTSRTYTLGSGAISTTNNFLIQPSAGTNTLTVDMGANITVASTNGFSVLCTGTTGAVTFNTNNYNITAGTVSFNPLVNNCTTSTLNAGTSTIEVNQSSTSNLVSFKSSQFTFNVSSATLKATPASSTPTLYSGPPVPATWYKVIIDSTATVISSGTNLRLTDSSGGGFFLLNGVFNLHEGTLFNSTLTNAVVSLAASTTLCVGGTQFATNATCDSGATQTNTANLPAAVSGANFSFNQTSTVRFLNDRNHNLHTLPFYGNLVIAPVITAARAYTFDADNLVVAGNFTINPNKTTATSATLTVTQNGAYDINLSMTLQNSGNAVVSYSTATANDLDIGGDLIINSGTTFTANDSFISLLGDYTNSGTFTAGTSELSLGGTTQQILTGTMTGLTGAFYDLSITNSSGSDASDGELTGFTAGVVFSGSATITNNYTITTGSVRVQYTSGSTYTLTNVNWNGGSCGTPIFFRNSVAGSGSWSVSVSGTQTAVSYLDVSRSNNTGATITATNTIDSNNNTGWSITGGSCLGISLTGTVRLADESTAATTSNGGDCDGSTAVISVRVNGGSATTGTCSGTDGTFSISVTPPSSGDRVVLYLTGSLKANYVYISDGTAWSGINLTENRVSLSYQTGSSITIASLTDYDNDQNATDMLFDAEDSATDTLNVESGVELHLTTSKTFAPAGTVTTPSLHIQGTYTGGSETLTLTGSGTGTSRPLYLNGGTFTANSNTVTYTGTSASDIEDGVTYNNLQLYPTSGTQTYTLGTGDGATITVNGNLEVGNGSTLTIDAAALSSNVNLTGNLTLNSGVVWSKGAGLFTFKPTGTKTWTDSTTGKQDIGSVTVGSGSSTPKINLGSSVKATSVTISSSHELNANGSNTLTVSGTGTPLSISGTFTYSTGTVEYNGAGSVTVTNLTGTGGTNGYYNLLLDPVTSSSIAYGLNGAITTNGDFTVNPNSAGLGGQLTVNMTGNIIVPSTKTLTVTRTGTISTVLDTRPSATDYNITAGLIVVGSGGTLDAGSSASTITVNGTSGTLFTKSGTFTQGNSTLQVTSASGPVTLLSTGTTLNKLTINASSVTVNAGAAVTLSSADTSNGLVISAGTFDDGGNQIAGTSNGSMSMSSGTTLKLGAGTATSFPTNFTNGIISLDTNSTVVYNATVSQNISGVPTYGHLQLSRASGTPTKTLTSAVTVAGNLTIDSSNTLDVDSGGNYGLIVAGNFTNNGTFTARAGTVTLNGTASGKSITSNGSALNNLTVSGSGGDWAPSDALTVGGDLTMTAGTISGSQDITASGNVTGTAGVFNLTGGTFKQRPSGADKNFGTTSGFTSWTFNNLVFSIAGGPCSGSKTITTESSGFGGINVNGVLAVGESGDCYSTTLNAGNRTWSLAGNGGDPFQLLASPQAILTPSTSAFAYTGNNTSGSTIIESNASGGGYNSLFLNNSSETYLLEAATTVGGNLTITSGTLDVDNTGNYGLTIGGSYTNHGTFTARAGTVTLNATGTGRILNGTMTGSSAFYNLTFNGSGGGWISSGDIEVSHDLGLSNGTFDTNSVNNYAVTVGNNVTSSGSGWAINMRGSTWTVSGNWDTSTASNITAGTSTLVMNGGSSKTLKTVGGGAGNIFYNLQLADGSGKTTQLLSNIGSNNVVTVGAGTLDLNTHALFLYCGSGNTNSLSLDPSATVGTGKLNGEIVYNSSLGSCDMNIPAHTYDLGFAVQMGGGTITQTGNVTVTGRIGLGCCSPSSAIPSTGWDTGGFDLTIGAMYISNGQPVLTGNDSTITITDTIFGTRWDNCSGGCSAGFGIFDEGTSKVVFAETTSGGVLYSGGENFYDLEFNGSGGGWTPSDALTVSNDLTMTAGSLLGTQDITVNGNTAGTAGVINRTGGTFEQRVAADKNFGTTSGSTAWTFSSLTFSNSTAATPHTVTTQTGGSGGVTVTGVLRVGKSGDNSGATTTLDAGNRTWTLSGANGDPFQLLASPAGALDGSTSTFAYTGNLPFGNTIVQSMTSSYNNLTLNNGSETYILEGDTAVDGNLTITAGILDASGSNYGLTIGGNYSNSGTFTAQSGTVTLSGSGSHTLSGTMTGTSSFYDLVFTSTATIAVPNCERTGFVATHDFSGDVTVTHNFDITTGAAVEYNSGSTYSFANINWDSGADTIFFRNSATSGTWLLEVSGTQTAVKYVDVSRSDASGGDTIDATDSSNNDCSNNTNWAFNSVTGTVYLADESSPATAGSGGPCDSSTAVVSLRVDGGTEYTSSCSSSDGSFTLLTGDLPANSTVAVYLTSSMKANTLYLGNGGSSSGINLYENRVVLSHENAGPIGIAELTDYDNDQNATDMLFDAEDSATDTLNLESGTELHVPTSKTFTPAGNVTTPAFHLQGTYTGASETLTLSGSGTGTSRPLYVDGGTFSASSNSTVFTGTSTTDIEATTYNNLQLYPSSGTETYSLNSGTLAINGNLEVNNGGTLTLDADTNDPAINLIGDLTINTQVSWTPSASTAFTFKPTGTKTWTDNSGVNIGLVTVGSGSSTPKVNLGSDVAVTTVTINASHELNANGSHTLTISGTGTPLTNTGDFRYSTGTVRYTGNGATNITSLSGASGIDGYYNLEIKPAGAVTHTLGTGASQTIVTNNNLTIGDGTNTATITNTTNDVILDVNGSMAINSAATYNASDSSSPAFTIAGSYSNAGTFTAGTAQVVTFDATTSGKTLSGTMTGSSSFWKVKFHNSSGGGTWTIQDPMTVDTSSGTPAADTLVVGNGTVTVGNGNGDNLSVYGGIDVAVNTNETGTLQTMDNLPEGSSVTIQINKDTSTTCANCVVDVGALSGSGQGTLTINENGILKLVPKSTATASNSGVFVVATGKLNVAGKVALSSATSTAIASYDNRETKLCTSGTFTTNQYTNMHVRITNGLARGQFYPVTGTTVDDSQCDDSTNDSITRANTSTGNVASTSKTVSGALMSVCIPDSFSSTDKNAGYFLRDFTGTQAYFQIVYSENDSSSCTGTDDLVKVIAYPDSFSALTAGDTVDISDGVRPGDTFEIYDFAYVTAENGSACNATSNNNGAGYIRGNSGADIAIQYAEICNLGRNSSPFFGIQTSTINGANTNEGLLIDHTLISGNYYGLFASPMLNNNESNNHGVTNSAIINSGADSIRLSGTNGTDSGNLISGNFIKGSGSGGITSTGSGSIINVITQNTVLGSTNSGISATNGADKTSLTLNTSCGNGVYGIYSETKGNNISSNFTCGNSTAQLAAAQSTGVNNYVSSNTSVSGSTSTGITAGGDHNIFYSNAVYGNGDGFSLSGTEQRLISNTSYGNTRGLFVNNSTGGSNTLIKESYGVSASNSIGDISNTGIIANDKLYLYDTTLGSTTEVSGITASGSFVISRQHDNAAATTKVWGEYSVPADVAETPQVESTDKYNYTDSLWEKSITAHGYSGTGTEDSNLSYDLSSGSADLSSGPYIYRLVAKTAGSGASCSSSQAVFDVFRNGTDVGDATSGTQFTDTSGGVNLKFTVDCGSTAYAIGDVYTFVAYDTDNSTTSQKALTMMQDGDTYTVASGKTLEMKGQNASSNRTTVTHGTGGYNFVVAGTIDAQYYDFDFMGNATSGIGLDLQSTATITNIADGHYANFSNATAGNTYVKVNGDLIGTGSPSKTFANLDFTQVATNRPQYTVTETSGSPVAGNYWLLEPSNCTSWSSCEDSDSDAGDGGSDTAGYIHWVSNTAPNAPTSLDQAKTDDTPIATGDWVSTTDIKFTASASDTDSSDTLQLCVETKDINTVFDGTGESCGSGVAYSGSPVGVNVTITGQTDATAYHWRARTKDAAGAYSSYAVFGGNSDSDPADRDYGIDTTACTYASSIYDGNVEDSDAAYNDGSLDELLANWDDFSCGASGLVRYDVSIGTTAGGTDILGWSSNTTNTTTTQSTLNLHTNQDYYMNVRAIDNAGNTSSTYSSNGQYVLPILSFSMGSNTLTFSNLNSSNNRSNSQDLTLTSSTNAYGGYVIRQYAGGLLTSGSNTIPLFQGGSYASPAAWGSLPCTNGVNCGYGFTSNDTSIQGSNLFNSATLYAAFALTPFGDIVADHTSAVTGSTGPVTNESFTITHKVAVDGLQEAKTYSATVYEIITGTF